MTDERPITYSWISWLHHPDYTMFINDGNDAVSCVHAVVYNSRWVIQIDDITVSSGFCSDRQGGMAKVKERIEFIDDMVRKGYANK